ncbi:hypothetical protein PR048_021278 [Dryococelus australis]|uniref:Uncharacterized protein n=1 Tax=Dryococelus australis TaxID=614101 RepID=A0ABQ9GXY0_9NEOP|nr:hypothetical protein PR048_021278 [Dryococelus australis]
MERRRNETTGKTGDPRDNPPTNGIVRHDSHMRKPAVTRPGIEPGSLWWKASRLTAQSACPSMAHCVSCRVGALVSCLSELCDSSQSSPGEGEGVLNVAEYRSKYRNRVRLERASKKQSSDTHTTPYDRVKWCQERLGLVVESVTINLSSPARVIGSPSRKFGGGGHGFSRHSILFCICLTFISPRSFFKGMWPSALKAILGCEDARQGDRIEDDLKLNPSTVCVNNVLYTILATRSSLAEHTEGSELVSEEIWAALNIEVFRADDGEGSIEQRKNERVDPRENPPASGITRHDTPMRNSVSDPAGSRTRFAWVGGDSYRENCQHAKFGSNRFVSDIQCVEIFGHPVSKLGRRRSGVWEIPGSNPSPGQMPHLTTATKKQTITSRVYSGLSRLACCQLNPSNTLGSIDKSSRLAWRGGCVYRVPPTTDSRACTYSR